MFWKRPAAGSRRTEGRLERNRQRHHSVLTWQTPRPIRPMPSVMTCPQAALSAGVSTMMSVDCAMAWRFVWTAPPQLSFPTANTAIADRRREPEPDTDQQLRKPRSLSGTRHPHHYPLVGAPSGDAKEAEDIATGCNHKIFLPAHQLPPRRVALEDSLVSVASDSAVITAVQPTRWPRSGSRSARPPVSVLQ